MANLDSTSKYDKIVRGHTPNSAQLPPRSANKAVIGQGVATLGGAISAAGQELGARQSAKALGDEQTRIIQHDSQALSKINNYVTLSTREQMGLLDDPNFASANSGEDFQGQTENRINDLRGLVGKNKEDFESTELGKELSGVIDWHALSGGSGNQKVDQLRSRNAYRGLHKIITDTESRLNSNAVLSRLSKIERDYGTKQEFDSFENRSNAESIELSELKGAQKIWQSTDYIGQRLGDAIGTFLDKNGGRAYDTALYKAIDSDVDHWVDGMNESLQGFDILYETEGVTSGDVQLQAEFFNERFDVLNSALQTDPARFHELKPILDNARKRIQSNTLNTIAPQLARLTGEDGTTILADDLIKDGGELHKLFADDPTSLNKLLQSAISTKDDYILPVAEKIQSAKSKAVADGTFDSEPAQEESLQQLEETTFNTLNAVNRSKKLHVTEKLAKQDETVSSYIKADASSSINNLPNLEENPSVTTRATQFAPVLKAIIQSTTGRLFNYETLHEDLKQSDIFEIEDNPEVDKFLQEYVDATYDNFGVSSLYNEGLASELKGDIVKGLTDATTRLRKQWVNTPAEVIYSGGDLFDIGEGTIEQLQAQDAALIEDILVNGADINDAAFLPEGTKDIWDKAIEARNPEGIRGLAKKTVLIGGPQLAWAHMYLDRTGEDVPTGTKEASGILGVTELSEASSKIGEVPTLFHEAYRDLKNPDEMQLLRSEMDEPQKKLLAQVEEDIGGGDWYHYLREKGRDTGVQYVGETYGALKNIAAIMVKNGKTRQEINNSFRHILSQVKTFNTVSGDGTTHDVTVNWTSKQLDDLASAGLWTTGKGGFKQGMGNIARNLASVNFMGFDAYGENDFMRPYGPQRSLNPKEMNRILGNRMPIIDEVMSMAGSAFHNKHWDTLHAIVGLSPFNEMFYEFQNTGVAQRMRWTRMGVHQDKDSPVHGVNYDGDETYNSDEFFEQFGAGFSNEGVAFSVGNWREGQREKYDTANQDPDKLDKSIRVGKIKQRMILMKVIREKGRIHYDSITDNFVLQVPIGVDEFIKDPTIEGWQNLGSSGGWETVRHKVPYDYGRKGAYDEGRRMDKPMQISKTKLTEYLYSISTTGHQMKAARAKQSTLFEGKTKASLRYLKKLSLEKPDDYKALGLPPDVLKEVNESEYLKKHYEKKAVREQHLNEPRDISM
jgi:hypothetical protein